MKYKKIFLLSIVVLLLVGVSYATDISDENENTIDTATNDKVVQDTSTVSNQIETNTLNREKNINKIVKAEKNIKTTSKTYDVDNFDSLHEILTSNAYDTLTINIKSDIKLANNTKLNKAISQLTINGNNKTINGVKKYQFLKINSSSQININNIKITGCSANEIISRDEWADYTRGGAIYTSGNLSITNSEFNNNYGFSGGAIYCLDNNLTLINTTFKDNHAVFGEAVYVSDSSNINISDSYFTNRDDWEYRFDGEYTTSKTIYISSTRTANMTIFNSTFNDNKGVVYFAGDTLNITSSIFTNNHKTLIEAYCDNLNIENSTFMNNDFPVLYSYSSNITIGNSTFRNNNNVLVYPFYDEDQNDTFIYNNDYPVLRSYSSNITIGNSTFRNNNNIVVSSNEDNNLNVRNSKFINNKGCAINSSTQKVYIGNSTFINNTGAISTNEYYNFNHDNNMVISQIENNTFINNLANISGKAIINNGSVTVKNNINANTSRHNGTIIINYGKGKIINNVFDDKILNTKITITINNTKPIVDDKIKLTYTLRDVNNNKIVNERIVTSINGKAYNLTTDKNGIATQVYSPTSGGNLTIVTTYKGNIFYNYTKASKTINVKKINAKLALKLSNTKPRITDQITLIGKLTDEYNKSLRNIIIRLTINNNSVNLKTDANGKFNYTHTTRVVGTNNITVKYAGNTKYNQVTNKTTFKTSKLNVKIVYNKINATKYGNNVIISGKLVNVKGKVLGNTSLKLQLNNKTGTIKTNSNGVFSFKTKAGIVGTNNVTIGYLGNKNYNSATNKTSFKVFKQSTKLSINKINAVVYGFNVTIGGKLMDANGKILGNTVLKLKLNNKTVSVKTNSNGVFSFKTKASIVGTNNLTVSYSGNKNYNSATNKTSFKVFKQSTKLSINKINAVVYGFNVTISGKLMDANGKILDNTVLKLKLNNKTDSVKTNSKGVFTYKTKAGIGGINNITVTYSGNKNYNPVTSKTTFKVMKNNVTVSISSIEQGLKTREIKITGKMTESTGKILKNSKVTVIINNKNYYTKTNNNGVYTFTTTVQKNTNNIIVGFDGNKNYNKYRSNTLKFTII